LLIQSERFLYSIHLGIAPRQFVQLQTLIPTLLRVILNWLWGDRLDWFFGVNMGVYSNRQGT
jgi:hypothetical protein